MPSACTGDNRVRFRVRSPMVCDTSRNIKWPRAWTLVGYGHRAWLCCRLFIQVFLKNLCCRLFNCMQQSCKKMQVALQRWRRFFSTVAAATTGTILNWDWVRKTRIECSESLKRTSRNCQICASTGPWPDLAREDNILILMNQILNELNEEKY